MAILNSSSHHPLGHLYHLRIDLAGLLHPLEQLVRIVLHFSRCIRKISLHHLLWILKRACKLLHSPENTAKSAVWHNRCVIHRLILNRAVCPI